MMCISVQAKYAAVVMDAKSGRIIDGVNFLRPAYPASLTKMMTLYLLFDALNKKRVTLDTRFYVSARACAQKPSKLGVRRGQTITVRECILALAVRSANDVAVVVAENLAGSQERFAYFMNHQARAMHMNNTYFCNASGWHHPAQKTTAHDMAVLTRNLWKKFPRYRTFLSQRAFCYGGETIKTTNKLLGKVQGLCLSKTGYTGPAGFNLATVTQRGDKELIVVMMGGKTGQYRDKQVKNLIEASYNTPYLLSALLLLPTMQPTPIKASGKVRKVAMKKIKSGRKMRSQRKEIRIPWNKIA